MSEFEAWKNTGGKKKALVVKGLRQIGKTYSVREFAKVNYKNIVYVNFAAPVLWHHPSNAHRFV